MSADRMHCWDAACERLADQIDAYVRERLRQCDSGLNAPLSQAELERAAGPTITPSGLGAPLALRLFTEILAPSCIDCAHPRFFSFVPHAPTQVAALFDAAVSASGIFADWWLEGSGAIHAENEALRWIADLLGWPATAGGVFVSGGTAGNLNGLAVARDAWRARLSDGRRRGAVAIGGGGHSSLRLVARVLDIDVLDVPVDEDGRMRARNLAAALQRTEHEVFAVAATAGTTNLGVVDDLAGVAELCRRRGLWMHVDGAYGGAALAAPSARALFEGIERADSFVVDPHKWLFAPLDCAALVYRDASLARAAYTQRAEYLEVVEERTEWNPSDYAVHLTRRARGLPFWFSLAVHGTRAYAEAIEHGLELAREAARRTRAAPYLELAFEPELSVVVFRRAGWSAREHLSWSERAFTSGLTMTAPTGWRGETWLRMCFVNPRTTPNDIQEVLDALA